jgi:hypothetical protein
LHNPFVNYFDFVALVLVVVAGLGWPIARRLNLFPGERLLASVALSLTGVWLIGWGVYVAGLPAAVLWVIPALAVAGLAEGRKGVAALMATAEGRGLVLGQFLVTLWALGLLLLVTSYSGGAWAADWLEHLGRAQVFAGQGDRLQLFLGYYPLPARPPLVNAVEAALTGLAVVDFPHLQLAGTVLASLVFLPLALLAARWGARAAPIVLTLLLLANPAFAENATFFWTKLPTAFFVLTCVYFFLHGTVSEAPNRAAVLLCGLAMGAAILSHYSAVPYAVVTVAAWVTVAWRRADPRFWRWSLAAAALAVGLLALWFGWSLAVFGFGTTFLQNSTVMNPNAREGGRAAMIILNIRDTVVPAFLRHFDQGYIAQRSPWGYLRDYMFNLYQQNLLFGLGSLGWVVFFREAWVARSRPGARSWGLAVGGTVLLGIAASGDRQEWGIANVCLQPLLLGGLAFLASRWATLPRFWRILLAAGGLVDLALGVALQFLIENFAIDRWNHAHFWTDIIASYSWGTVFNLRAKVVGHVPFVADAAGIPPGVLLVGLGLILAAAIAHVVLLGRMPRRDEG